MRHHYTDVDIARFWSKVDKSGTCWLWTDSLNVRWGYGYFRCSCGKSHRANRVALELALGRALLPKMLACHDCPGGDNRACVRHLFEGTHRDNLVDAIRKGTHRAPRGPAGSRHSQAKLTEANVIVIRRMVANGSLQRVAAELFGVRENLVSRIVNRRIWTHI